MNNIAFYNGVKMTVEEASKRHDMVDYHEKELEAAKNPHREVK